MDILNRAVSGWVRILGQTPQCGTKTTQLLRTIAGEEIAMPLTVRQPPYRDVP